MAIGFTPKHIQDFPLNDLTQQQFLVLAHETVRKQGWKVSYISGNGLIAYTDNGMFSRNAEIIVKAENGTATIRSASTGTEMMDWGKNRKNVAGFIANLEELRSTLGKEELYLKYLELQETFSSGEEDIHKLRPANTMGEIKNFLLVFKPVKGFFVTPILIDLNILIFILMAVNGVNILMPDNISMLKWGANFRPVTLEGEWWRLITNCFLHIGILHLVMNMYALLYIGTILEPHLGKTRFITAYLLAGVTASTASLWWNSLSISAGASGAIFGMYGIFLAMLTTDLIEKNVRRALLVSMAIFVGYNLLYGLKGGIDNAAHIGGLIVGLVIGYAMIPSLKEPEEKKLKYGTLGLLSLVIFASSFVVYKKLPNDIVTYDAQIKKFVSMEAMALEVYDMLQTTPREKLLYEIKDRGIYYWNENIKLIDSFSEMDLPPEIKTRNRLLKEYCELRIQSYELLYKAVSENTDRYGSQMENYNTQIEAKIKEITGGGQNQ